MARANEIADGRIATRSEIGCQDVSSAVARLALRTLMTLPAGIGIWSALSIISAAAGCESFQVAGRGLIMALTGI